MRKSFAPHVTHVPVMLCLPFFIRISTESFISRFALHFRQYASTFLTLLLRWLRLLLCHRSLLQTRRTARDRVPFGNR